MARAPQETTAHLSQYQKDFERNRTALHHRMMAFAQNAAREFHPYQHVTNEGFIPLSKQGIDWGMTGFPDFLQHFFQREVEGAGWSPVIWTRYEEDGLVSLFLGTDSSGRGLLRDGILVKVSPTKLDINMTTSFLQIGPNPVAQELHGLREYIGPRHDKTEPLINFAKSIVDFAEVQVISAQRINPPLTVV
jgi:hypothetical protein